MFDWNRDKTADLAELSRQLWDLKHDQIKGWPIKMIWCQSISISIGWFVIINKTLIITRSITDESTKNSKKNLTNLNRVDN